MKNPYTRLPVIALMTLVFASYLQVLLQHPDIVYTISGWAFLGTGVIYSLFAIFWMMAVEKTENLAKRLLYFVVQISTIAAIFLLTPRKGSMVLLTFPIVSQACVLLRGRYAAGMIGLLFLTIYACYGVPDRQGLLYSSLGIVTGFAFVIAFTMVAQSERAERFKREQLATELEKANEQLRANNARLREVATMEERNRLAREIHDGLGHYLSLIVVQIEAAKTMFQLRPGEFPAVLDKAQHSVREALHDVRRSVRSLRTGEANDHTSLERELRNLLARQSLDDLAVELVIAGEFRRFSTNTEHNLFRLIQEALTNIRKHAGATLATIRLDFTTPGCFEVDIEDNGRGAAEPLVLGNGLAGMRERMTLLNASFAVGNRPKGGFYVKVSFYV